MKRVLVVDDSAMAREILTKLLGDRYTIESVSSGALALAYVEKSMPDIMLLDLLMPGMDGFAVLDELAKRATRFPVLVLSADIQTTTRRKVIALGAVDLVNKPPRREILITAIEAALAAGASDTP